MNNRAYEDIGSRELNYRRRTLPAWIIQNKEIQDNKNWTDYTWGYDSILEHATLEKYVKEFLNDASFSLEYHWRLLKYDKQANKYFIVKEISTDELADEIEKIRAKI